MSVLGSDVSTTSTTPTVSAMDALINSLTVSLQSKSDEVNRTYAIYVLKDKAYKDALAYEAEIDRQRLEKIADNDPYNTNILNEKLRNEVRPAREEAGRQLTAAKAAWEAAQADFNTEKGKLTAAEKNLIDAKIKEQVALSNANASTAQAKAETTLAETNNKLFTQKSTQYVIIAGVVVALLIGMAFAAKKLNLF